MPETSPPSQPVAEVPRDVIRDSFAAVLQARLSWPQADACAADLIGFLHRQGFVVFREYHPDEVPDLRVSATAVLDEAYRLIYSVGSFGTERGQRDLVAWIARYHALRSELAARPSLSTAHSPDGVE